MDHRVNVILLLIVGTLYMYVLSCDNILVFLQMNLRN